MKYTILGFSQKKAVKNNLDINDLLILRYIADFYSSMTKEIIENKEYGWLSYQSLLKNLPILPTKSKDSLFRRIKVLERKEFIERKCLKNKKGSFSYVRLTDKMQVLVSNRGTDENQDPHTDLNPDPRTDENQDQTNSSIKLNSSIKKEERIFSFFKELYKKYNFPKKITEKGLKTAFKENKSKFIKCIDNLNDDNNFSEQDYKNYLEDNINNYLEYLKVATWRGKMAFSVFINKSEKYGNDWVHEKTEALKRQPKQKNQEIDYKQRAKNERENQAVIDKLKKQGGF